MEILYRRERATSAFAEATAQLSRMAGKLDPQYDATLAAVARIRTECERLRQELDAHRLREHRHREAV